MKKQASLVVVGAFCPNLSLWHTVLEEGLEAKLNVSQSQLSEKEGAFYFQISLQGEWHQMAKFELALDAHRKHLAEPSTLQWMRAEIAVAQQDYLPYQVEVLSLRNAELIGVLTYFFDAKGVKIKEMRVQTYVQAQTFVPMQAVYLTVWVPLEAFLPDLRENFMILCDEYNLDALFEQMRM